MANAILNGLLLGGMYALMAMGLTLQYGVARIMNLAYGDFLIAASFAAYWLFIAWSVNPIVALALIVPANFAISWAVYSLLMTPLVERAKSRDALEVDSLLATFGLLFVIQGVVLVIFGGAYYSYSFLSIPVPVLGATPLRKSSIVSMPGSYVSRRKLAATGSPTSGSRKPSSCRSACRTTR